MSDHAELHDHTRSDYLAIHHAFKEARRQLQDYVQRMRGDVKMHSRVSPARRDKLAVEGVPGVEETQSGGEAEGTEFTT